MSKTTLFSGLALALAMSYHGYSAERPTLNHTRDPRPDILPHPIYYAHTEYRRVYNRPRNLTGWIASYIAPSSQEAMVWEENWYQGNYDQCHQPPMYKRYFAPKPWQVLETGPRPNVPTATSSAGTVGFEKTEPAPLPQPPRVPAPVEY